eukprot:TRINITY_DN4823_c0_g1_i1.p1 TRINITY_DN4823_c0_g1~~TRINITY_DN4823_c0_g1_i1.p1  ORF type:complete len:473 (-),score=98.15 TRINITY_DN4823_c0_g1_i1:2364-3656(-)
MNETQWTTDAWKRNRPDQFQDWNRHQDHHQSHEVHYSKMKDDGTLSHSKTHWISSHSYNPDIKSNQFDSRPSSIFKAETRDRHYPHTHQNTATNISEHKEKPTQYPRSEPFENKSTAKTNRMEEHRLSNSESEMKKQKYDKEQSHFMSEKREQFSRTQDLDKDTVKILTPTKAQMGKDGREDPFKSKDLFIDGQSPKTVKILSPVCRGVEAPPEHPLHQPQTTNPIQSSLPAKSSQKDLKSHDLGIKSSSEMKSRAQVVVSNHKDNHATTKSFPTAKPDVKSSKESLNIQHRKETDFRSDSESSTQHKQDESTNPPIEANHKDSGRDGLAHHKLEFVPENKRPKVDITKMHTITRSLRQKALDSLLLEYLRLYDDREDYSRAIETTICEEEALYKSSADDGYFICMLKRKLFHLKKSETGSLGGKQTQGN